MPSEPNRKSWSNLPIRCALRSIWNSLSCQSVCATACEKESPLIVSCANSGFEPDHVRPLELTDEGQGVPDRGEEDVATRLVGLGFESDAEAEVPRADVLDSRDRPPPCSGRARARTSLAASASTPSRPPHITWTSAPSSAPSSMASHVFLTAKSADGRIVRREGTLLEDGAPEEVGRRHRDLHPGLVERGVGNA